jgi:hypothetical protein
MTGSEKYITARMELEKQAWCLEIGWLWIMVLRSYKCSNIPQYY